MRIWHYAVAVVAIVASTGAGMAYAVHSAWNSASERTMVENGVWQTDPTFGSAASDDQTRAHLAVIGLLGLPRQEAIYYIGYRTQDGQSIDADGIYEIRGKGDLPGRWWSLTVYGEDQYLAPNPANRYSIRQSEVQREADGSWRILLARNPQPGNWIPLGAGDDQSLILRIYNPEPSLEQQLATVDLPTIRRIGDAQ